MMANPNPFMRAVLKALASTSTPALLSTEPASAAPHVAGSTGGEPVAIALQVLKAEDGTPVKAQKRVITIWASVSADAEGNIITDHHQHLLRESEMEDMAWHFTEHVRIIGAGHTVMGVASLVGSLPLTADLQKALNAKTLRGWLIQVRIPATEDGDALLAAYERGEWDGASIAGTGEEHPVSDAAQPTA